MVAPRRADRRLLLAVAGLVGLWASVVFVGRLVAPEPDPLPEQALDEAMVAPTATAAPESKPAPQLPTEDLTDPDLPDDHNFVTRRIAMNNVQVDRMKRQLERRNSSPTVAYRSAEGVVYVHLGRGVAETAAVTDQGEVAPGQKLLRSDGVSVAIDPLTLAAAIVADEASLVIAESLDGATYFVDAAGMFGTAPLVESSDDGETIERAIGPAGHELLGFDGLGVVAVSKGPTSGTRIARGAAFDVLSDHRVLTATSNAMLEQVCDSPLVCKLSVVDLDSADRWDVPASFGSLGDSYYLAPDGGSLLRVTPGGFAEAFVNAEQAVAWVIGQGMRSPAWGSQSNYVVWLDLVGEPNLKIMFVDERDWLSIDLSALDAPLPTGPEFVIFENAQ